MSDINSLSMGPHDGGAKSEFDQSRAEKAVTELLLAIGEDFNVISMDYNLFDREKGFVLEDSGTFPDKYDMLVEI